jgi:hypothetical protein
MSAWPSSNGRSFPMILCAFGLGGSNYHRDSAEVLFSWR